MVVKGSLETLEEFLQPRGDMINQTGILLNFCEKS